MRAESLEFFRQIVNTPSPSGYEQRAGELYRRYTREFADSVQTDVMGNVIAAINPAGRPRVMFAGHMDEIGFIVKYISEEGFLYFGPIGGHDPVIPVGQRVLVHTRSGPIPGVIGKKPIHLMEEDERSKAPKLHELWVDIGATSKADAQSVVRIGDPITIDVEFRELRNGFATARGFDNKMGAFIVAEALRLLSEDRPTAAVFAVATVQEEIGLRGARTSAYGVDPQVGIAVDVTHATDYPSVDKKRVGEILPGKGPVICRGANINPRVFDMLVETAEAEGIPYQLEAAGGGTGTDANAMQISRAGMATGLVSVPLRYMHTPCELLALEDVENAARLLAAFTRRINEHISFIPEP
ncbi:MAG: M42 family metallopeptidase [Fimbriimonadales bacterium]|mgnify:CR=1 FL=1|jgi:endoglucanase|nr:M42 family metallopeptidase [Armatimonadota bacterium]MCX7687217.1 M42 family metallopeptidase [Fimbriimonadales bacterium]CUU03043.1 endoglucanase [Armatimonadetes bacterium GBS]CUU34950.1 endoglucanase [Armatimonadetes bacterium DC]CUU37203.1 endoglucanase [Armatimonadetes bacterium GXS]GBC89336.1 Putative aminopeptidase YsdC [bacterium HR14]